MVVLAVGLLLGLVMIPILTVTTLSPLLNVLIGLSPFLLTVVLAMLVVQAHYKRAILFVVLLIVHFAALGFLYLANGLVEQPIDVNQATGISFLLSALLILVAWAADAGPAERKSQRIEFERAKLPDVVQSIEDKCKAINFAIGRVYRSSNGGTKTLRERLRVPREWYNEFSESTDEDREQRAVVLIRKILDRLFLLVHKENEVLSDNELKNLKNLERSSNGDSTVLDVLSRNDSDPVQHYFAVAVDACQQVLTELDEPTFAKSGTESQDGK